MFQQSIQNQYYVNILQTFEIKFNNNNVICQNKGFHIIFLGYENLEITFVVVPYWFVISFRWICGESTSALSKLETIGFEFST